MAPGGLWIQVLGALLGNYRIVDQLGEGGMGLVYIGRHEHLGRRVVVKVLQPEMSTNADMVQRFFNEAQAATAIRNPGIAQVFDFGATPDGRAYFVMELLEGESLSARLKKRRLDHAECCRIGRQIANVMQAAHAAGITHRDLKPDNLFLVPDPEVPGGERVKVLDFGIAKLTGEAHDSGLKTRTGMVMGTPNYMSPEQCRSASNADARSDIYSLGCVLFRMVCGSPPFSGAGLGDIIGGHLHVAPPQPQSLAPNVPPDLAQLILHMLEKDPDARPQTMAAVSRGLEDILRTLGGSTRASTADPVPTRSPAARPPTPLPGLPPVRPTPQPRDLAAAAAALLSPRAPSPTALDSRETTPFSRSSSTPDDGATTPYPLSSTALDDRKTIPFSPSPATTPHDRATTPYPLSPSTTLDDHETTPFPRSSSTKRAGREITTLADAAPPVSSPPSPVPTSPPPVPASRPTPAPSPPQLPSSKPAPAPSPAPPVLPSKPVLPSPLSAPSSKPAPSPSPPQVPSSKPTPDALPPSLPRPRSEPHADAPMRSPVPQLSPTAPTISDAAELYVHRSRAGGRRRWLVLGGLAIALLIAVALALVIGGSGAPEHQTEPIAIAPRSNLDDAAAGDPSSGPVAADAAASSSDAIEAECRSHQEARRWAELEQCASKLEPLAPQRAAELHKQAAEEPKALPRIAAVEAALRANNLWRAKQELDQVWPQSVDYPAIKRKYDLAETQAITDLSAQLARVKDADCEEYNALLAKERTLKPVSVTTEAARRTPCAPPACIGDAFAEQGQQEYAAGELAAALASYESAYACRATPQWAEKLFVIACNLRNLPKSKLYWKRLSPSLQTRDLPICVRNEITEQMLNAP